ncbi:MAG: right-handed parallel beta-helix repeat-containing protein [Thermoplasmata archaeon]|nr:MAG: right-handed parallel beta-helix repeat-containing protein [Thermoplasmata archaeon]
MYSDAIIGNNTIINNTVSGIQNIQCSNATIDSNTISYNGIGIKCELYSSPVITFNNITFNQIGILSESGSNAPVHWNNIHNNSNYNVSNLDDTINISAIHNYWGSDPPNDDGFNGPVDYRFWEAVPIEEAGPG